MPQRVNMQSINMIVSIFEQVPIIRKYTQTDKQIFKLLSLYVYTLKIMFILPVPEKIRIEMVIGMQNEIRIGIRKLSFQVYVYIYMYIKTKSKSEIRKLSFQVYIYMYIYCTYVHICIYVCKCHNGLTCNQTT